MNKIEFILNEVQHVYEGNMSRRLLDVLREDYQLVGPKEGCGEGECGACAILLNHEIINACLLPIGHIANQTLMTIEGFSKTSRYALLESSFMQHGAVQCGFCTPGMLIASESLLNKNPHPNEEQIRDALSGNLCRCTGYNMIVEAILDASRKGEGLW